LRQGGSGVATDRNDRLPVPAGWKIGDLQMSIGLSAATMVKTVFSEVLPEIGPSSADANHDSMAFSDRSNEEFDRGHVASLPRAYQMIEPDLRVCASSAASRLSLHGR
jgi:hypothetical protein